jgi:hypothetical protein
LIPGPPERTFGRCRANCVDDAGLYKKGDVATEVLRPFFERVFDKCNVRRPVA